MSLVKKMFDAIYELESKNVYKSDMAILMSYLVARELDKELGNQFGFELPKNIRFDSFINIPISDYPYNSEIIIFKKQSASLYKELAIKIETGL